jgi:methylated-DNA-[protein]-cysteine S-methyltransferase
MITYDTPVGTLTLAASDLGLTRVSYGHPRRPAATPSPTARNWLDMARRELDAYFDGRLRTFTVPVDLRRAEPAHLPILDALTGVAYGETTTYGALAAAVGLVDDGPRQVGVAMARNPVAIVVPCHRVIGAGGKLTGYGGGLTAKRLLLDLEARDSSPQLGLAIALPGTPA